MMNSKGGLTTGAVVGKRGFLMVLMGVFTAVNDRTRQFVLNEIVAFS
jgi:hypothetical protein